MFLDFSFPGIIISQPGDWFSTFQMTMLGIVFLQHIKMIPTIDQWRDLKNSKVPPQYLPQKQHSMSEIFDILKQFFQFVLHHDFWTKGQ